MGPKTLLFGYLDPLGKAQVVRVHVTVHGFVFGFVVIFFRFCKVNNRVCYKGSMIVNPKP